MRRDRVRVVVCLLLSAMVVLAGCGSGDEHVEAAATAAPGNAGVLAWDPPLTYEDSTPLDPYRDLDCYEFYLRGDASFTDADLPVAQVAAVTNVLSPDGSVAHQKLTTEFELENLLPFVTPGSNRFLSIRAVGMDGLKSGFSQPVIWNLPS